MMNISSFKMQLVIFFSLHNERVLENYFCTLTFLFPVEKSEARKYCIKFVLIKCRLTNFSLLFFSFMVRLFFTVKSMIGKLWLF